MVPDRGVQIALDPDMPTGRFEQHFESEFGLHIQIFRLQQGVWLQTTSTDHLSLKEQNQRGLDADRWKPSRSFQIGIVNKIRSARFILRPGGTY
ncbi:MAG: hypothetical protein HWD58_04695 [Bacteroidota bacterium]|nr:MAG: hypothetical protein HWD58_04695 [Bacteroidota bacterium]